jgi:transcriptional regulator with XRE-family HTH domain
MTATFTNGPSPSTVRVRWLMEEQHRLEIGERIRELRENSAETNRSIADAVGVGERSVASWMAGGGITYDNAQKVAEVFGVDVDYIWRGRTGAELETPDVMGALSPNAEVVGALRELERQQSQMAKKLDRLLAVQTELLAEVAKARTTQASQRKTRVPAERKKASG